MHRRVPCRALVLLLLVLAGACGESSGPAIPAAARSIVAVSPQAFGTPVGSTPADPLVVRVQDDRARPVRGARVTFTAAEGMATLTPAEVVTDAAGEARTKLTVGPVAGRVDVTARLVGSDSSAQFTITAAPLAPSRIVVIPAPMWLDAPGATGQLLGNLTDQHGNGIGTAAPSWRSLDESVATVTAGGVVTGVRAGATARIEARIGDFRDTVLVSVADPATPACAGATPVTLQPGESITMDARTGGCLRATARGEYAATAYFASDAPSARTDDLRIVGTGLLRIGLSGGTAPAGGARALTGGTPDEGFEDGLRAREEREIAPRFAASRRAVAARGESGALFNAVPASARVGDRVTINASPDYACSFPDATARRRDTRTGRIVAISQKAIIVADTANPAGGFTDADYRRIATTFDTLVAPLNEGLFGTPGDRDRNQRSIIFYTARVNEIPTSGDSYIGGFFWARDLLDRSVCETSNVGEIFYMLVPDPGGALGAPRSASFVEQVTIGTLGHEYQHLINASRRHADPQAEPAEASWLNEGLSHIAEEMLFYRVSGLAPRANISGAHLADARVEEAYSAYQHSNVARLERWLVAPGSNTPFGTASSLATRGAAWAFLRYLADRRPSDGDVWYRLVNSRTTGVANVAQVFEMDVTAAARDWATAMFADDYVQNAKAEHQLRSWDLRSVFLVVRGAYPLRRTIMGTNAAYPFALTGGAAAYFSFAIDEGHDARLWVTSVVGTPQPPVKVTLLRVR